MTFLNKNNSSDKPYIGHIVYPIRITSKEYPLEMADALFSLQRCRNLTIDFPTQVSYI
ncbi:hypothetical protein CLOBOL_06111 [Enterocloster bolteae ATCC BAA-613]|uniref:Uncharacterized protein n=1 Tax=Enterocloster bolteae (strain ATCC BAA-613 / DSM 15670 / CCUG 46953 / JCM 12243 / WAL 16351) TaxID=411902 RepID=A8S1N5_ENTBW|nr:hypothetical protein CLOBOL_06111 [Enterocloster bolteae ATCC BAA-613]